MADLLLEIGVEEIPASYLEPAMRSWASQVEKQLSPFWQKDTAIKRYWTPRRLAITVSGLVHEIPGRDELRTGPPARLAWEGGTPEGKVLPALAGFCRKNSVDAHQAELVDGPREPMAAVRVAIPRLSLQTTVADHFGGWLQGIPFPKTMFWNESRFRFARPIRWLVAMMDDVVIPLEVASVRAGNRTLLHRNVSPQEAEVTPQTYVDVLRAGQVEPVAADRLATIREQLGARASEQGVEVEIPEGLLAEVANICEAPTVLSATFDDSFLLMPQEVIRAPLIHHQRYFPTRKSGKISSVFLFVTNSLSDKPEVIALGNAKVLHARLRDAAFFWEEDRKTPLHSRVDRLSGIVYHNQLGSYADKVRRESVLGDALADLIGVDKALLRRITELAYADLLTGMVCEFPELEGVMGRYYAAHDQEPDAVVTALEEGRKPRAAGDDLPSTDLGKARALVARLETLSGFFARGIKPTGSKDPYALRRAGIAINRLMAVWKDVDFGQLWPVLSEIHGADNTVKDEMEAFLRTRWEKELAGEEIHTEEIRATAAALPWQPGLARERAAALANLRTTGNLASLLDSYKRLENILVKDDGKRPVSKLSDYEKDGDMQAALVTAALQAVQTPSGATTQRLQQLAHLATQLDNYFDTIFVLDSDLDQRHRNLGLLRAVQQVFHDFASFEAMVY